MRLATGEGARKQLPQTMPGGLAVLDYDGDGRLDLFFPNANQEPDRLFRNMGGMRFEDVSTRAGITERGYHMGASAADFDGDGRTDLAVSGLGSVIVYRNRGDGTFAAQTLDNRNRWAVAAAWMDVDRDGDLDLFVVNYVHWDPATERECIVQGKPDFCHPRFYQGSSNALFRNEGSGKFREVSDQYALDAHIGKGMSAAVSDFNGDGFPDVFVTNDRVFNFLFLNEGGKRFREEAFSWGAAAPQDGNPVSAMGVDAQDLDGDGRPDLVFTALRDETFPIYRNLGASFAEITGDSKLGVLTRPMSGWGVVLADLDNDGWKDIAVARSDALSATGGKGESAQEPPSWFRNQGNGTFTAGSGWERVPKAMYRGIAAADLDNDGCLDVVLTSLQDAPRLLRNPCTGSGRYLFVDVREVGVRVRAGKQWRESSSAAGYSSSNAGPLHFGLGSSPAADVEVIWPDGLRKVFPGTKANQTLRVTR
jgi:hypothetical protein